MAEDIAICAAHSSQFSILFYILDVIVLMLENKVFAHMKDKNHNFSW